MIAVTIIDMNRGKPVKANYGDKGGVFIPGNSDLSFGYQFDLYLDAVVIGTLKIGKKEYVSIVFTQNSSFHIKKGDIYHIPAKQWHGSAYHS